MITLPLEIIIWKRNVVKDEMFMFSFLPQTFSISGQNMNFFSLCFAFCNFREIVVVVKAVLSVRLKGKQSYL